MKDAASMSCTSIPYPWPWNLAHTNNENGAYKQSSMEKSSQVALYLIFFLHHMDLDLDLEKSSQIMEKREDWGFESENQPLTAFHQIQGQNLSLENDRF